MTFDWDRRETPFGDIMIDSIVEKLCGLTDIGSEPPRESEINQIAAVYGIDFPVDYRDFVLRSGGMAFAEIVRFKVPATGQFRYISYFYGGGKDRLMRLDVMAKNYGERISDGWIPIGGDGFGNQICLCGKGPQRGSVGFWNHELEGKKSSVAQMSVVAESFTDWIKSLNRED